MGIGTTNLKSTATTGDVLPAEQVDDLSTLIARADDESLYDLIDLEPPAAATSTSVNTGYIPLRSGPLVTPDAFSRIVWVAPARWCRSSTSTVTPRRMLSSTVDGNVSIAMPTIAPFGKWRIELLYAQLAYANPTDPTKGTTVSFLWATSPVDANLGSAAAVATLPANTSTTWNIPIQYVKNIAGATAPTQHDLLSPTPTAAGGLDGKLRRRVGAGAIDAQRGYSSAAQALSALAAANTVITTTATHPGVHKADSELVVRTLKIDAPLLAGTGGSVATFDVDDTRDWRNADFVSFWNVPVAAGYSFGEEDPTVATSADRQLPESGNGAIAHASYMIFGQSFEPWAGSGTLARAARVVAPTTTTGYEPLKGSSFIAVGDYIDLVVDMTTGKMRVSRKIAGAGAGSPITVILIATFPNSR